MKDERIDKALMKLHRFGFIRIKIVPSEEVYFLTDKFLLKLRRQAERMFEVERKNVSYENFLRCIIRVILDEDRNSEISDSESQMMVKLIVEIGHYGKERFMKDIGL